MAPYTYAVTSGTLPGGLSLNTNTGAITGTPNVEISSTITLTATDANGCPGSRIYTLAMSCPPITINPASLSNGLVGTVYTSATFTATGGTAPYQFSVISGTLPAGLTLTSAGVLSGTPTGLEWCRLGHHGAGSRCLQLPRHACLHDQDLPGDHAAGHLDLGHRRHELLGERGGHRWRVSVCVFGELGSAPAGLSLNTATGSINGAPTNTTSQTFTITATDANNCSGARSYTLTPVCPAITLTPASLTRGTWAWPTRRR